MTGAERLTVDDAKDTSGSTFAMGGEQRSIDLMYLKMYECSGLGWGSRIVPMASMGVETCHDYMFLRQGVRTRGRSVSMGGISRHDDGIFRRGIPPTPFRGLDSINLRLANA